MPCCGRPPTARASRSWIVLPFLLLLLGSLLPLQEETKPPAPAPPRTALEWNEAGVAALEGRDFDLAIRDFLEAHELAAKEGVYARNLSRAYVHRGRARFDAGHLPMALLDYEAAARADRDGGVPELFQSEVLLRMGRRVEALERVDRARADFPGNARLQRLAADLRALAGRLDEAVSLLEDAQAKHPDPELETRLRQLREEQRALSGFLHDRSAHFEILYDPARQDLIAALPDLSSDLEDAYQAVAVRLGLAPQDRIVVLILDRDRYLDDAPRWSGALYDGRIRLSFANWPRSRPGLRATMRHEYVHAALQRLGPPLPTWLQEGLAEWVEGRSVDAARAHLRGAPLPPASSLGGDWTVWEDEGRVARAYAYALSFCAFLDQEYGPTAFPLLFEKLRAMSFDDAFRAVFGKDLAAVDAEHRRKLLS